MKSSWNLKNPQFRSVLEKQRGTFLAAIAALLVDLSVFQLSLSSGLDLGAAHMISFLAAFAVIYFFVARPAFAHAAENRQRRAPWLHGQFGLVGLLALSLRGGVLSLLVKSWGWAPQVAMFPAAVVGTLAMVGAVGFLVRLWEADGDPELRWRRLVVAIVGYVFAL